MSLTIKPAEDIHDFHETIQKEKGKIKYKDYEMIQNIRKHDIPEMKKTLEANIAYNTNFKKPDGKPWTPEELEIANKYWKELLNSINTLEKSWSEGSLTIENHKDEAYKATVSETQKKLKELFGNHGVNPITPPTIETQAMHESPETLIKGVQEKLNNYANNSNGKYLNIDFKGTRIFTKEVQSIELYGITLFKKTTEGGDTAYRPIVLGSTFSLQETRLGKLKSVDVLYGEIIKKIEESDNPATGEPTITTPPIVTDTTPLNPSPVMTEGSELTNEDIKRRNEKYIKEHNIAELVKNTILAPLINDPTRENILKLQDIIGYPGKKDGIMGPITLGKIKDYIKNQSNNPPLNADLRLQYNHTTFLNRDEHRRAWETFKSQPLTPEQQKNAENIQKNLLYIEFAKLYHQIATEANESKMELAGLRVSKDAARKQLEYFGKLITSVTSNPQDTTIKNTLLSQIKDIDNTVGRITNLIGGRIEDIIKIIEGKGTADEKYVKILDTLRGGYIESGTTKAGDIIAPSIIESQANKNKEIKNIQDILSDTLIKTHIQAATSEKQVIDILTTKGISNSIAKDVASVWTDIKKNLESNKDTLIENYKKQNPGKIQTARADVDALIGEHIYIGSMEEFQRVSLREVIKSNGALRSDPKVELFAQAEGIDTWSIRDSRKAAVTEGAITLAMMAIPMGMGMAVGRLAARGVSGLANLSKATATGIEATANVGRLGTLARGAVGMERLEKSSRVYHLLGKGLPIAGESFTFTESFNIMNNLLYKDSLANWNDGSLNAKENAKNLAFFGILNSVQKLYAHTGLLIKPGATVPTNVLKGSTQILAEAGVITVSSPGIDVMFGEEFHPTWEEFFQALLMTAVFKGIPKGKEKMKKPQPEPEPIVPAPVPVPVPAPTPAPTPIPIPKAPKDHPNGGSPRPEPTGKSRDGEKGTEKPIKFDNWQVEGSGNNRKSSEKSDDIVDAEDVSKRRSSTNNNQPLQLGHTSGVGKVENGVRMNNGDKITHPDKKAQAIKDAKTGDRVEPWNDAGPRFQKQSDGTWNEISKDGTKQMHRNISENEVISQMYSNTHNRSMRMVKAEEVTKPIVTQKAIPAKEAPPKEVPRPAPELSPIANRDYIANELSVGRKITNNQNIIDGTIEIGGKKMHLRYKKYNEFRDEYFSIINSQMREPGRSEALMRIDTRLAERLILNSGSRVEVASAEQATAMVDGLGKVAGYKKLIRTESEGRHFVSLAP